MMTRVFIFLFIVLSWNVSSKETLKEFLKRHHNDKIPYIQPYRTSVLLPKNSFILDARETKEFEVSHLNNAIHIGYKNFDLCRVQKQITNKESLIVVYSTIGKRSEEIAEKLKSAGFLNVFNLFGGIIQWKNKGMPVYDWKDKETKRVHVFNKEYGKWLTNGRKVY